MHTHLVEAIESDAGTVATDDVETRRRGPAPGRSEAERQAVFDALAEHVLYQDTEHRITWANRAACESAEMTIEELITKRCFEIWSKGSQVCPDCPVEEAMATGQSCRAEKETPDGRIWSIQAVPIADSLGAPTGAIEITQEITRHRETERCLSHEKSFLESLVDALPGTFFVFDEYGQFVRWNRNLELASGYSGDEIRQMDPLDFVTDQDRELTAQAMAELFENGAVAIEASVRTKGGENIPFFFTGRRATIDGKRYLVGVGLDITESKNAERLLRHNERFLSAVFDGIQDGISILDNEMTIVRVNRWMERMYAEQMPLVGKKCYLVYQRRDAVCPWCPVKLTLETGEVHSALVPYPCEEHPTGWIDLSAFPLTDAGGAVTGVIEHVKDVTDRLRAEKSAQEDLAELTRAWHVNTIGEMASGLAHELNQPLCAILNYSDSCVRMLKRQMVRPGKLDNERLVSSVEQISAQAERAAEIIKRIRNLVEKREPRRVPADVNRIIEQTLSVFRSEAGRVGVNIECELAAGLPAVLADEVEIQQVILNLVNNAVEAILETEGTDCARRVVVSSREDGQGYVGVAVRDQGRGLDEQTRQRMFDSFFTTKTKGLGVGLSLSQRIVEAHKGRLWAEANSGPGATLKFTLPTEETAHGTGTGNGVHCR